MSKLRESAVRLALSEQQPGPKTALLRVPFVRRCELSFDDGATSSAFLVNINALGVYVAHDEMPRLGQGVRVQFSLPDSDRELSLHGSVVWLNPRQQHPVHSLPPGFGVKFVGMSADDVLSIERVITEYRERDPGGR
jgi:Tfp pilus assembly protein PilZ